MNDAGYVLKHIQSTLTVYFIIYLHLASGTTVLTASPRALCCSLCPPVIPSPWDVTIAPTLWLLLHTLVLTA